MSVAFGSGRARLRHRGIRLRLLPSGPDLIRVPTSRRTRPSTRPRRTNPDGQPLGTGFGPARADCGLQGTADSPPSTVRSILLLAVGTARLHRDQRRHILVLRDRPGRCPRGGHRGGVPQALPPPVVVSSYDGIVSARRSSASPTPTASSNSSPTSAWGCSSTSPATRSTSSGSRACRWSSARWAGLISVGLAYGIGGPRRGQDHRLLPLHGLGDGDDGDRHPDPILRDNGGMKTRFGTYLLAAGGAGEFGPILLVTLFLLHRPARCTRR